MPSLPHDNDNGGLVRLVYRSSAALPGNRTIFLKIVEAAAICNAERGITGAISFDGFEFVQVLEGESDIVKALMFNIMRDKRHEDIEILSEKRVPMRRYSGWAMKPIHHDDFQSFVASVGA